MYVFYAANINTRTHIITSNSHLEHYYIQIKYETIYIIDIYVYIQHFHNLVLKNNDINKHLIYIISSLDQSRTRRWDLALFLEEILLLTLEHVNLHHLFLRIKIDSHVSECCERPYSGTDPKFRTSCSRNMSAKLRMKCF